MSFRDNLQHLRAERHMTQEQLAMLLGVSRQSVTKWEAEKSQPEMDKLLKICQIFECSLDELVTGDLTGRAAPDAAATIPAGPPTDVCGYDEHQRMMALKVPAGIAAILVGIAIGLFFEGAHDLAPVGARDGLFVIIVLAGVLVGLAFLVPAGMEHAAFQKAHPYVEDFYTEDDRAKARRDFSTGLIAGIAFIFAGIGCLIMVEPMAENAAEKSDNIESIRQGLKMIIQQFFKTFDELGVRKLESVGAKFDPERQEAVANEDSDTVPEGEVIREWSSGFMLGDRLLRPARVVVSSGKAGEAAATETPGSGEGE